VNYFIRVRLSRFKLAFRRSLLLIGKASAE
jgi:hypothetical protein